MPGWTRAGTAAAGWWWRGSGTGPPLPWKLGGRGASERGNHGGSPFVGLAGGGRWAAVRSGLLGGRLGGLDDLGRGGADHAQAGVVPPGVVVLHGPFGLALGVD